LPNVYVRKQTTANHLLSPT
jgi:hypothetical protein